MPITKCLNSLSGFQAHSSPNNTTVLNLPVAGCSEFILPHLPHIFSKSSARSTVVILECKCMVMVIVC